MVSKCQNGMSLFFFFLGLMVRQVKGGWVCGVFAQADVLLKDCKKEGERVWNE